jgi:hypothetical protein
LADEGQGPPGQGGRKGGEAGKNNIMHMIFVDINRALEKNLAEMSDFDQLMCFLMLNQKKGCNFYMKMEMPF